MTAFYLFGSTFVLVFALGLQSLNVNGRHYVAAFLTSFLIGGGNLVLFKLAPDATGLEMAAFMLGGPFGIVASMLAHPVLVKREGDVMKKRRINFRWTCCNDCRRAHRWRWSGWWHYLALRAQRFFS